jgi:hypothetical protein
VRLRSSASAYFNRTPASAGNRQIYTRSAWVKRGALSSTLELFSAGASNIDTVRFTSSDNLLVRVNNNDSTSNRVFRDPSAWGHLVVAIDTTQATSTNRMKAYWNNELITWSTYAVPAQNTQTEWNNNVNHNIGSTQVSTNYFDGYLTEFNNIDGQALTPFSFGETDSITGVWKPKAYSGTYGTNGFELNFSDNSNNTAATIGKDYSGNGNNWTPNNISVTAGVTYDSMQDVPTLTSATAANYCVWNPLDASSATTSNANLTLGYTTYTAWKRATIGVTSGKWYWEITPTSRASSNQYQIGIALSTADATIDPATATGVYMYFSFNGNKYSNGSNSAYGASYDTNDVIGVAFDADAGTLVFYKNNTSQGTAFTGLTSGPYFPMAGYDAGGAWTQAANFGQQPFTYTPPTGYVALNTYNLPASTITNGAAYMAATTYTGTGSSLTVSNAVGSTSFKPDLVWVKRRDGPQSHQLYDINRGVNQALYSNLTNAETTEANGLSAFTSSGFTVISDIGVNTSGGTYVGWNWKASNTTASNTNGSITSTVSAGATQGFSVVTYTGTGANATVGHGLGVAPSMIIVKVRNAVDGWFVYNKEIGNTKYLRLNTTDAASTFNLWQNTSPTSSVFSIATDPTVNYSGYTYVAYCFAAVAGYSAFGSFTGNGSADGPFVYTSFRPRFILWKNTSLAGTDWTIVDSSRNTYNVANSGLQPNGSYAEASNSNYQIDFLSNGFKVRTTNPEANRSGDTIIYACFAESPFKFANAR